MRRIHMVARLPLHSSATPIRLPYETAADQSLCDERAIRPVDGSVQPSHPDARCGLLSVSSTRRPTSDDIHSKSAPLGCMITRSYRKSGSRLLDVDEPTRTGRVGPSNCPSLAAHPHRGCTCTHHVDGVPAKPRLRCHL